MQYDASKIWKAIGAAGLFAAVLAGGPNVMADDTMCPPSLGAVTVDNVVVVAEGCRLDGTTVKGNVKVMPGGGLATFGASIFGNVQGEPGNHYVRLDCATVSAFGFGETADCAGTFRTVVPTRVGGDVQIKGTVSVPPMFPLNTPCEDVAPGTPGPVDVNLSCKTKVGGDVQLEENRAAFETNLNRVRGDVQVFKNGPGNQEISNNVIGGNLQCKENSSVTGGGNAVAGNKEDQCAGL